MRSKTLLVLGGLLALAGEVRADSIWERRDPNTAYLFTDLRARRMGDLLTVVINENTELEGLETRQMNKETATSAGATLNAKSASGGLNRSFSGEFDGSSTSKRKFDGKNNTTIDRKFVDRMTVTVVGVMPNGNLIIEGYRKRTLTREIRVLRLRGVVRPADIGPFNTVQSQAIADCEMLYMGRGPESAYTNQGWGGRIMNVLWPF
ncbi:MAG: flagellar basal body L-ring protein FlgH [Gemmataceae bacterium]